MFLRSMEQIVCPVASESPPKGCKTVVEERTAHTNAHELLPSRTESKISIEGVLLYLIKHVFAVLNVFI